MIELADTSAWVLSRRNGDARDRFDDQLRTGRIAICDAVKLELLYAARNGPDLSARRTELEALAQCPIGPHEWRRALDVYETLAHEGGIHHRRVRQPDLLVAAAAESAGVAVLHYNADFDVIASVTGQPTRWIAARGSV